MLHPNGSHTMQLLENKMITVNGCSINVLMAGDFSKTPLFFLHGKAFQAETWQELGTLQVAIDAGFSVLAIDLPGFGKSPEADIDSTTVIDGVMEAFDIENAILIGPSMSGKIAIEYAVATPQRVVGLALIGAVGVQENRHNLHKLPAQTLIIWGENDQISDPENSVLLKAKVPGSELVIFKGAPHPCYLEQTKLWHDTLLNFANRITT